MERGIRGLLVLLCLVTFSSCEKDDPRVFGHEFELDVRLGVDKNDYYHLELGDGWQTVHRISGSVSPVEEDWALTKVYWESSHYWLMEDTLGYIVHQNNTLNDGPYYITNDTTYITGFSGLEVPTINDMCYSTNDGEINIMFAPVQTMIGDTITVSSIAHFADGYISEEKLIKIIIE